MSNIVTLFFVFLKMNVTDCDKYLKRSLFLVGEIGGNDYNYAAFAGGTINQLLATVPIVVEAITNVTSVCANSSTI